MAELADVLELEADELTDEIKHTPRKDFLLPVLGAIIVMVGFTLEHYGYAQVGELSLFAGCAIAVFSSFGYASNSNKGSTRAGVPKSTVALITISVSALFLVWAYADQRFVDVLNILAFLSLISNASIGAIAYFLTEDDSS